MRPSNLSSGGLTGLYDLPLVSSSWATAAVGVAHPLALHESAAFMQLHLDRPAQLRQLTSPCLLFTKQQRNSKFNSGGQGAWVLTGQGGAGAAGGADQCGGGVRSG